MPSLASGLWPKEADIRDLLVLLAQAHPSDRCEAVGIVFIPLVVDTFGGWHKDSLEVITKLGRQVSRQTGREEDEIVRQLRQRVAILLVRDNVNMFDIPALLHILKQ